VPSVSTANDPTLRPPGRAGALHLLPFQLMSAPVEVTVQKLLLVPPGAVVSGTHAPPDQHWFASGYQDHQSDCQPPQFVPARLT
jgi:hypothetical protein